MRVVIRVRFAEFLHGAGVETGRPDNNGAGGSPQHVLLAFGGLVDNLRPLKFEVSSAVYHGTIPVLTATVTVQPWFHVKIKFLS